MTENFDMSNQESGVDAEPNLSQLKKVIEVTPSTLKDITSKQEFLSRVIELCNKARESINIQRAKQALVYLNEGQKILQYAASCGKTIDKYIIISLLHNIACCYQKIWELEKCSQYLQALIYNFNYFMKEEAQDTQQNWPSKNKADEQNAAAQNLDRKTFLVKYYLQYCAVNSQTDNHSGALVAARKAISINKSIFQGLAELAPSLKKMTYQKKSQFEYKLRLIDFGARFNQCVNIANYQTLLEAAKYYLSQWAKTKANKDRIDRDYVLQQEFKNYSIGNAMQIVSITYKDFQYQKNNNFSSKILLEKVLLMALGFFTISTQLRLLAGKKNSQKNMKKSQRIQQKQSQMYHLLSIILTAACIPFEILYMKHVLSSYTNHYGCDLLESQQEACFTASKYEELIFPFLDKPSIKNNQNNSVIASIQPQETTSDFASKNYQPSAKQFASKTSIQDIKQNDKNQKVQEDKKPQIKKKQSLKLSLKPKSKSKSKHMKSGLMLKQTQAQKTGAIPKSPRAHLKSPTSNNMIKVKTSYKLKVSTQKIITSNHNIKQQKIKKNKNLIKTQNMELDYYLGQSKEIRKLKKSIEMGLTSPKANGGSRSNSKRQSPIPKAFDPLKSPVRGLKSPRKNIASKAKNFQQYYI